MPRPFDGGKIVFSLNDAKTTRNKHSKKGGWTPYLTPQTKVNSKLIIELTGNMNTIGLLEENIGANLCDLELSNEILHIIPRTWETKEEKR